MQHATVQAAANKVFITGIPDHLVRGTDDCLHRFEFDAQVGVASFLGRLVSVLNLCIGNNRLS